jgi:hypothetical protein
MKTIGQIALLILQECQQYQIENSLCVCVDDLNKRGLLTEEEAKLFYAVISGWQAVGDGKFHNAAITVGGMDTDMISGKVIQENFMIFIDKPFEVKRQWLVNLAVFR